MNRVFLSFLPPCFSLAKLRRGKHRLYGKKGRRSRMRMGLPVRSRGFPRALSWWQAERISRSLIRGRVVQRFGTTGSSFCPKGPRNGRFPTPSCPRPWPMGFRSACPIKTIPSSCWVGVMGKTSLWRSVTMLTLKLVDARPGGPSATPSFLARRSRRIERVGNRQYDIRLLREIDRGNGPQGIPVGFRAFSTQVGGTALARRSPGKDALGGRFA